MANSFFPRIRRGKDNYLTTLENNNMLIGDALILKIQRKLIEKTKIFIQNIFNYKKLEISNSEEQLNSSSNIGYSLNNLIDDNGHSKFEFGVKLFDKLHKFEIKYIPALINSKHIKIFFNVLSDFMYRYYELIDKNIEKHPDHGHVLANSKISVLAEMLIYNMEKTIVMEYLYATFNEFNEQYENPRTTIPNLQRYDIDLLDKIYEFAKELSTRVLENEEIYCGFIFHDDIAQIENNSVKKIVLKEPIEFGYFDKIKNILNVSNGQNIFFNVSHSKITHIFITKSKVNEIYLNPFSDGKTFQDRPLIVSIQGHGKIFFLEGKEDKNAILLQINNSKPVIKDNEFIKTKINGILSKISTIGENRINLFINWIMSISLNKHGTTLVIGDFNDDVLKKLIKYKSIEYPIHDFLSDVNKYYDIELLNSLINPDGALLFNNQLIPETVGTILPFSKATKTSSGGSRHNSALNFSSKYNCIAIVISEDGPITIFENGVELFKF